MWLLMFGPENEQTIEEIINVNKGGSSSPNIISLYTYAFNLSTDI